MTVLRRVGEFYRWLKTDPVGLAAIPSAIWFVVVSVWRAIRRRP